jgi:hypothetical protein
LSEEEIGDRDRDRERDYRHRHIDIDIETRDKRKSRERRFYIPVSFENTFDLLQTILKREGSNFSRWVRDNAESYVRLHEPGNPQQRLDTILKLGKAYHAPSPICGFKDCMRDVVAVAIFLQTDKEYGLCEKHKKEAEELGRKVWRFLKK